MTVKQFTVCILLYGDYPHYASRLLESLSRPLWRGKFNIRIGMNNVSDATIKVVASLQQQLPLEGVLYGGPPYWKYPMMRRLFYTRAISTPFVMWFDDDSWIQKDAPDDWYDQVLMDLRIFNQIGSVWHTHLRGGQAAFIEDACWYRGRRVFQGMCMGFVTGGWWAIHTAILQKHDWPMVELEHNGGDVMLGALFQQQNYPFGNFTTGVAINADESGKCSTATRRGFRQDPLGVNYHRKST